MSIYEIARCLYKRNHADVAEYAAACRAFDRLSNADQAKVEAIGKRYA